MRQLLIFSALSLFGLTPAVSAQGYAGPGDPIVLVDSWYRTYLGRPAYADPGSADWVDALYQGTSPQSLLANLLGSEEYYTRSGGSMAGFIRNLYLQTLGRAPTPGEQEFWMRRSYTQDRKQIASEILTQNPGRGIVVTPPATVAVIPELHRAWVRDRERRWAREREREREHYHHSEHDYRRPYYPYRR